MYRFLQVCILILGLTVSTQQNLGQLIKDSTHTYRENGQVGAARFQLYLQHLGGNDYAVNVVCLVRRGNDYVPLEEIPSSDHNTWAIAQRLSRQAVGSTIEDIRNLIRSFKDSLDQKTFPTTKTCLPFPTSWTSRLIYLGFFNDRCQGDQPQIRLSSWTDSLCIDRRVVGPCNYKRPFRLVFRGAALTEPLTETFELTSLITFENPPLTPTHTPTPTRTHTPTPTRTHTPSPTLTFTPEPTPTDNHVRLNIWNYQTNPTSLNPFSGPFTKDAALYLYKKIGVTPGPIDQTLVDQGIEAFVEKLIKDCDYSDPNSKLRQLEPVAREILYTSAKAAELEIYQPGVGFRKFHEVPSNERPFMGPGLYTRRPILNYLGYHFLAGSPLCPALWIIWQNWFAINNALVEAPEYSGANLEYMEVIQRNLLNYEAILRGTLNTLQETIMLDLHLNKAGKLLAEGLDPHVPGNRGEVNENYPRELIELRTIGLEDVRNGAPLLDSENFEQSVEALTRATAGSLLVNLRGYSGNTFPWSRPKLTLNGIQICRPNRVIFHTGRGGRRVTGVDPDRPFFDCRTYQSRQWEEPNDYRLVRDLNEMRYRDPREQGRYRNGIFAFQGTSNSHDPLGRPDRPVIAFAKVPNPPLVYISRHPSNPSHRYNNLSPLPLEPQHFNIPQEARAQYDGAIDVLEHLLYRIGYEEGNGTQTARRLAVQLLGFFIGPRAARTPSMINRIAEIIVQDGFRLHRALKTILMSEALFSTENKNTIVKTPLELGLSFARVLRVPLEKLGVLHAFLNPPEGTFTGPAGVLHHIFYYSFNSGLGFMSNRSVFGTPHLAGTRRNNQTRWGRGFITPFSISGVQNMIKEIMLDNYMKYTAMARPAHRDGYFLDIRYESSPNQWEPLSIPKDYVGCFMSDFVGSPFSLLKYLLQDDLPIIYFRAKLPVMLGDNTNFSTHSYHPYSGNSFNWRDYLSNFYPSLRSGNLEQFIIDLAKNLGIEPTRGQIRGLSQYLTNYTVLTGENDFPNESNTVSCDQHQDYRHSRRNCVIPMLEAQTEYWNTKIEGLLLTIFSLVEPRLK